MDLGAYRSEAEEFLTAMTREYHQHFAGHKAEFEIETLYEKHRALFERETVERLREEGNRELLEFAVQGFLGQATKAEEAELARLEASLELDLGDESIPFRQSSVVQANETDSDRRAAIEAARNELTERELNPLHLEAHERGARLVRELGWPDMTTMCEELSGTDLHALGRETEAFLEATEPLYEPAMEPVLQETLGFGFDRLRRSDLAAFFRAPELDAAFPAEQLVPSLERTLAPLGFDLHGQANVTVDADQRPTKSPRAFCAPVRVPDEVILVIAPVGGRDDFEALFHEAGHTEHFAHADPELPFERRYLGDNSFTEAFAFLFQNLCHEPAWLRDVLGVEDPGPIVRQTRAVDLFFHRRYAAKIGYELLLHGDGAPDLPGEYARRLSGAAHVDWPRATWLTDVDAFFYVARYLRAWALERRMAATLKERFGERWWAEREAGGLLREIWSKGQRAQGEELLAELGDEPRIDFGVLAAA